VHFTVRVSNIPTPEVLRGYLREYPRESDVIPSDRYNDDAFRHCAGQLMRGR
jgi:hypothetical protein